jgi:hypothetical protein
MEQFLYLQWSEIYIGYREFLSLPTRTRHKMLELVIKRNDELKRKFKSKK